MVKFAALGLIVLVSGAFGDAARAYGASEAAPVDTQTGSREIAAVSVRRTVEHLGQPGGFYRTPTYHIPLPKTLDKPVDALAKTYASSLSVEVEKAINRAAEDTAKPAGDYILKTLPSVAFPEGTLGGPAEAVTNAVRKQISDAFREAMLPVVKANLAKEKAGDALERMRARYESIANAPLPKFDIEAYTLKSFADAFFASVAREEQNIRLRPSARSTEMLKQIFPAN